MKLKEGTVNINMSLNACKLADLAAFFDKAWGVRHSNAGSLFKMIMETLYDALEKNGSLHTHTIEYEDACEILNSLGVHVKPKWSMSHVRKLHEDEICGIGNYVKQSRELDRLADKAVRYLEEVENEPVELPQVMNLQKPSGETKTTLVEREEEEKLDRLNERFAQLNEVPPVMEISLEELLANAKGD